MYFLLLFIFSFFFLSTVVIQEVPKSSEKLYILDSIDVPLSDLNKYRHLSVVNTLPSNIVLQPPPLLPPSIECQEPNVPAKIVDNVNFNQMPQNTKDEFGERDSTSDKNNTTLEVTETKNMLIVKKVLKKYRKRDQMRNMQKQATACQQTSNEHCSDLSTPLRSLSPAHDIDSEMTAAVDLSVHSKEMTDELSVNSKEINEFIENLSNYPDVSEYELLASPLAEIMKLTENHQPPSVNRTESDCDMLKKHSKDTNCSDKVSDDKHKEKVDVDTVENVVESKTVEPIEIIEIDEEDDERENERENEQKKDEQKRDEHNRDEQEKVKTKRSEVENEFDESEKDVTEEDECEREEYETENNENEKVEKENSIPAKKDIFTDFSIDTLQSYCVKLFNTKEFRRYFKENIINATKTVVAESSVKSAKNREIEMEKLTYGHDVANSTEEVIVIDTDDDDDYDKIPSNNEIVKIPSDNENDKIASMCIEDQESIISTIPSLCALAKQAVRLNQFNMSSNLKPIVLELEKRKVAALDASYDVCANKVPTLQELAREVANTIYSFNVKSLQDLCKLSIEKFNHLYMVSQFDAPSTSYISEMNVTERTSEPLVVKGWFYIDTFFTIGA